MSNPMDSVHKLIAMQTEDIRKERDKLREETVHLRMQIGYIATELMVAGDKRSLQEIVETAAKATAPQ